METTFIYLFVSGMIFIGSITIIAVGLAILQIIEYIEDFLEIRRVQYKNPEKDKK